MNRITTVLIKCISAYNWFNIAVDEWIQSWVLGKISDVPKLGHIDKRYNIKINHLALILIYITIDVLLIRANRSGLLLLLFPVLLWLQIKMHAIISAELMFCVQFAKGDFIRTSPRRSLLATIMWNIAPFCIFFILPIYSIFFPSKY